MHNHSKRNSLQLLVAKDDTAHRFPLNVTSSIVSPPRRWSSAPTMMWSIVSSPRHWATAPTMMWPIVHAPHRRCPLPGRTSPACITSRTPPPSSIRWVNGHSHLTMIQSAPTRLRIRRCWTFERGLAAVTGSGLRWRLTFLWMIVAC